MLVCSTPCSASPPLPSHSLTHSPTTATPLPDCLLVPPRSVSPSPPTHSLTHHHHRHPPACTPTHSWKTPQGVFQAYSTYWPDGYTAQYAWAAAWMCKYDTTACPEAIATFNGESCHMSHVYPITCTCTPLFCNMPPLPISTWDEPPPTGQPQSANMSLQAHT